MTDIIINTAIFIMFGYAAIIVVKNERWRWFRKLISLAFIVASGMILATGDDHFAILLVLIGICLWGHAVQCQRDQREFMASITGETAKFSEKACQ